MSSYLIGEIASTSQIIVQTRARIVDGGGDPSLEWVCLEDLSSGQQNNLSVAGLLLLLGADPQTDWLPSRLARDDHGFLLTGRDVPQAAWDSGQHRRDTASCQDTDRMSSRADFGGCSTVRLMTQPPEARPAPSGTADERTVMEGFLEQYRAIVVRKVDGLDDQLARRELVGSKTTIAGLIKHLRWVEEAWFVEVLAGGRRPAWRDDDPERQFRIGDEPLAGLVLDYRRVCERSRSIAAEHSLGDTGQHPRFGAVSLRWIYLHMIEELARHSGHLDVLREQLDGVTGFD